MLTEIGQCALCQCIIYAGDRYQRAGDALFCSAACLAEACMDSEESKEE